MILEPLLQSVTDEALDFLCSHFDHGTTIIFKIQNSCCDHCIYVPIALSSPHPDGQGVYENFYVAFIQNHSIKNTTPFDFSKPENRIHSHCFHSKLAFQTSKNNEEDGKMKERLREKRHCQLEIPNASIRSKLQTLSLLQMYMGQNG